MSLFDLVYVLAFAIGLIVSLAFVGKVIVPLGERFNQTGNFSWFPDPNPAMSIVMNGIPFMVIGMGIGSVILALLIPAHPIFFPLSLIFAVFLLFINLVFQNFIESFVAQFPYLSEYPLLTWFLNNFGYIFFVLTLVILSVMYLVRR